MPAEDLYGTHSVTAAPLAQSKRDSTIPVCPCQPVGRCSGFQSRCAPMIQGLAARSSRNFGIEGLLGILLPPGLSFENGYRLVPELSRAFGMSFVGSSEEDCMRIHY